MEAHPDSNLPKDLRPLTPKQELFCHEYLKDRNGTQAAIRAGYMREAATSTASELLTYPNVRAKINELIKEQLDNTKIDATFVLRQILNSANIDIDDAYDENGRLKPISEMPEALRKSITSIETEELYEGTGKDREHIGTAKTIKIEGRLKALTLLGKHLKMFTDITEIPGLEKLAEEIKAARKRADECRPAKEEPPKPPREPKSRPDNLPGA